MISSFSVGNFGCNNDSPKVAKFLVASFATCISCLTIGYLSCGLFSLIFSFDVKIRGGNFGTKRPCEALLLLLDLSLLWFSVFKEFSSAFLHVGAFIGLVCTSGCLLFGWGYSLVL